MALPSNPQRSQAAAADSSYAEKKSATDNAAYNVSVITDKKESIKSRLSVATDPAEIQRLQAELAIIENDLIEAKNIFNRAVREEEITFYELLADGKIPVDGLNPELLKLNPGWNTASPSFLNDASSIVKGWLGNIGLGTTNGQLAASFANSREPSSSINMDLINSGRTTRSEDAMKDSVWLADLFAETQKELNAISRQLDESRRTGDGNTYMISSLQDRQTRQSDILSNISDAMSRGAVSVLKTVACNMTGRGIGGVFSPFQNVPFTPAFGGGDVINAGRGLLAGLGKNSALGTGVNGMPGGDSGGTHVWWDAPGPAPAVISGVFDDAIVEYVEPKLKHAYRAFFKGKLSVLEWLVKTIDRPKIDVEYLEQMRFNVKRNYPIKYNFGDLSITFWDDIHHRTVTAIDSYFHGNVWNHSSVPGTGQFLMRDSVVIPEFSIVDYVMESHSPLTYTFYNASLASFDFDGHDDTEDGGVHTVQVVLKIEGYKVTA